MPAFLVQISTETPGLTKIGGFDSLVVFASDSADALSVAQGLFEGDANAAWAAATATQLIAATDLSDAKFSLKVAVLDSSPVVDVTANGGVLGATAVAINAGGTGYAALDILTIGGGTSTRAATLRVTSVSGGVVDGIEMVDPGEYTAFPADPVAVTGGTGNDDATFDMTTATDDYDNFFAEMVGLLNATSPIAAAAIDMGASPPLLTIAAISDGIGDKEVQTTFQFGDTALVSFLGTIVDEGISAAVLTVEGVAAPVLPNAVAELKQ